MALLELLGLDCFGSRLITRRYLLVPHRLICSEDHAWFRAQQSALLQRHFGTSYQEVVPQERLVYGDYLSPGAEARPYTQVGARNTLGDVEGGEGGREGGHLLLPALGAVIAIRCTDCTASGS
jgi:hypothetical protein